MSNIWWYYINTITSTRGMLNRWCSLMLRWMMFPLIRWCLLMSRWCNLFSGCCLLRWTCLLKIRCRLSQWSCLLKIRCLLRWCLLKRCLLIRTRFQLHIFDTRWRRRRWSTRMMLTPLMLMIIRWAALSCISTMPIPPSGHYPKNSNDMIHKGHHIVGHVSPKLCEPTINLDLYDHSRVDSLINQDSTQSVAQLHPKSDVHPTPHLHGYLHPRIKFLTLIHNLLHLLVMIYRIIQWEWNRVPNKCANIYKIYSTQQ